MTDREKEILKEIKEREDVSEEHTGHWSYDDTLRAELKGIQEGKKIALKWIDDKIVDLKERKPKLFDKVSKYAMQMSIEELEELKQKIK